MNYNLSATDRAAGIGTVVPSEIAYDLDKALPYGDMDTTMLTSRFEETDAGDDENLYDTYARGQITNWGPDTNQFEHEAPRGGVTRRSGRLQLQYNGQRGDVDGPYHPEVFLGFMGPENRDPRGINVDPDFKELTKQQLARTRFVRWSPDGCEQITGGGRSEDQTIKDQQTIFMNMRDRLKIFNRHIDGRRTGLRREYDYKSPIPKQLPTQSYGDLIRDQALTPQRKANIICNEIIRHTRGWQDDTTDGDFNVARYTQAGRSRREVGSTQSAVDNNAPDSKFSDGDPTMRTRAMGVLMSDIVNSQRQRLDAAAAGDSDLMVSKDTIGRKTSGRVKDLALLTKIGTTEDGKFASADRTMHYSQRIIGDDDATAMARRSVCNHLKPTSYYFNADILYKSVKPGADLRKIKNLIVRDSTTGDTSEDRGRGGKSAGRKNITGARLPTTEDEDREEMKGRDVVNYRKLARQHDYIHRKLRADGSVQGGDESADTQTRRTGRAEGDYKVPSGDDTAQEMEFRDNSYQERHGRGLGSKYLTPYMIRDSAMGEIAAES